MGLVLTCAGSHSHIVPKPRTRHLQLQQLAPQLSKQSRRLYQGIEMCNASTMQSLPAISVWRGQGKISKLILPLSE
jgi:hypothetical protein